MPCAVFRSVSISYDSLCWATMVSDRIDSLSDQLEILPMCWVSVATIVNSIASRCYSCCNEPTYLYSKTAFLLTIPNAYFAEESLNSLMKNKTKQKPGLFIV